MHRRTSRAALLATVAAAALALQGCGGSSGPATSQPTSEAKPGGTLFVLTPIDFEHLDPQRVYVSDAQSFSRLIYRTLTTYKPSAAEGIEVTGDLATDTGHTTDGGKTWTFTLRDGLTYEDGTAITSADVKYGVERAFSDVLPEGPPYAKQWLVGGASYKGPYKDNGKGLASIETPDAKTIVFHLSEPHGDFAYTAAMTTFSPVPKARDKGVHYDDRPFSSGPYKIKSYKRGKEIVLERNTHWSKATDPVRAALPDSVVVKIGLSDSVIDQRLIASRGIDAFAVTTGNLQPESVAKVLNSPRLKERMLGGPNGGLSMYAINTAHKPLDKVEVRQAINLCTDRLALQTASGGANLGTITHQVLVPTVAGYSAYDPRHEGDKGDPEAGMKLLASAGETKLKLHLQVPAVGTHQARAQALQASLKRCGINVVIDSLPGSTYFTTIGSPAREGDLVFGGWLPDWPSASTVIQPLFDPRLIHKEGNGIWSNFTGPEADALAKEMDRINAIADPDEAAKAWGALDHRITDLALVVPVSASKSLQLHGSKLTNVYMQPFLATPDFISIGIKS